MAVPQKITDALARLNTETNEMGEKVRSLRDQIKVGMTQEDVDSIHSELSGVADRLDQFAADPEDPVPEPGPNPPEPGPEPAPESHRGRPRNQ